MTRERDDGGQLAIFIVFLGAVAALLAVVVVDASAAFLTRRDLASVADGAALAAAQSVDLDAYYRDGAGQALPLEPAARTVADYVAAYFPGVQVEDVDLTDGGRVVTVRLSRRLRLPVAPGVAGGGYPIVATATARLPLR